MKKKKSLVVLLSLTLILSVILAACGKVSDPAPNPTPTPQGPISSDWTQMPKNNNANLKYFGYFHVDGFKGSNPYYDDIAKLQNSNVMMINSAWSIEQSVVALEAVKNMGAKAFLSMHDFFSGGTVTVANSATLREDYISAWDARREAIAAYITDGTVIGFYFDEPAWNGVKETDFITVTKLLSEQYPAMRILNCMTVYDIGVLKKDGYSEQTAQFNQYVTDVMYDSYANWNDATRRDYLEKLKSKATNNQSIWGCAKGFSDNPEQIEEMVKNIKGIYTEAIQEPRYAGIISFSYADGITADWGYGLSTFFNDESEYYSSELRKLYINIGREVMGLEPYDFSGEIELTIIAPQEVYELGEEISLPLAGALNDKGEPVAVTYSLTDPRGNSFVADGSFTAEYSGKYLVKVSAGEGDKKQEKQIGVYVRHPGELSLFEDSAYNMDTTGTDADLWCWPRSVTTDIAYSGTGSLFVNTHVTDGTWPRLIFAKNGYQFWDITSYDAISLWIYNPSDAPMTGIKFFITDEGESQENGVFYGKDIPSKEWTNFTVTKKFIAETSPQLDLTKVKIILAQAGATYTNRTVFYIDEAMLLKGSFEEGFENSYSKNSVAGTADDLWVWPVSISSEQAKSGASSLKVTPHATDGTWPNLVFSSGYYKYFDITNANNISLWLYNPSDTEIKGFGLKINNAEKVKEVQKVFTLPSKVWTELTITKDEILAAQPEIDLSKVYVSLSQMGATYTNRTEFYIDDLCISFVEAPETDDGVYSLGFEKSSDATAIGGTTDDLWVWPVSISSEQAKSGTSSLKITPHATDGTWPNVVFKNGSAATFDFTALQTISLWVYNPSQDDISTFGLKINRVEKTYLLSAGIWTNITITKSEIIAAQTDINLAEVSVSFSQLGATYTNRTPFYIDDLEITYEI